MMVAAFKLRDLIPDTKDLLKWFWSLVWRIITGTVLICHFDKRQTWDCVSAGWRYYQLWKAPFGLYVQSRRCWFVVVPTLIKEGDRWSWTTSMLWHRWTKVNLCRKPPEPPCESLRVLEQDLIEWVIAQNFYRDKDIPHKVGVLLHGPPGSGKTQFVKRMWSLLEQMDGWHLGNELYKIQPTKSLNGDPKLVYPIYWAVAVWEDFDRYYHGDVGVKEDMPQFADVLRMLDERLGITFITVNDITKLDPAVAEVRPDGSISRPGRIDYVVYVGVADGTSDDDLQHVFLLCMGNDHGATRTRDLRFRKPLLYPTELRGLVIPYPRHVPQGTQWPPHVVRRTPLTQAESPREKTRTRVASTVFFMVRR